MPNRARPDKPATVTSVVALLWIAGGVSLLVGSLLLFPGTALDAIWSLNPPAHAAFEQLGVAPGIGFLALACVVGATARGLGRGRHWAWWSALVLLLLDGAGQIVELLVTRRIERASLALAITASLLAMLLSRKARAFCRAAR